jgi:hypothetical protein
MMDRRLVAARILQVEGALLITVALIHLAVVPTLRRTFINTLSPADFRFVWPPFLLSHVVVGVLLIPVGVSTLFCAGGIRRREPWAWRIGIINGFVVLSLPIVLAVTMEPRYFTAAPFLIASVLVSIVGGTMIWPLLWVGKN